MKKSLVLLLSVVAMPVSADIMEVILKHQPTRQSSSAATTSAPQKVGATNTKSLVSGKSCLDLDITEQKSLPLTVINHLIQEEPRKLSIFHNPRTGSLTISSPPMVGNCNSMIDWKVEQTSLKGENAYTVEAKFKENDLCQDGKCKYKIYKQKVKKEKVVEEVAFAPTMKGFLKCLEYSGAFKEGQDGPDADAIYYQPISVEALDIKQKGELVFVSEGPQSSQIGPAVGKNFQVVNDCKHYEPVDTEPTILLSQEDVERARLDREAEELKNCTVNEYHRIADFLNNYEEDYGFLKDIRDNLIKEAAIKSAKAMLEGKDTEEDMKVLADFEKYIVEPLLLQAERLYAEREELSGDERARKDAELKAVLKELAAYSKKPYFAQANTDKLMADGRFEAAATLHGLLVEISEYKNLGQAGTNLDPEDIMARVAKGKQEFADFIEDNRESYEIRTGQRTDMSKEAAADARMYREFVKRRTASHMRAIQEEQQRIQPGGYCYAYFRNTQKCIAQSLEFIQRTHLKMQRNNQVDLELAAEADQKAAEYRALEQEGRRYVAAQNGEPVPEEDPNDLEPEERVEEGSYSFDYNPQQPGMQPGMQQPGFMPAMQNPFNPMMNPHGQQGMFANQNPFMYQQPFMGQMGAFSQFGVQGNMGMNGFGGMNTYGMQPYMGMQQPMMGGGQQSYGFNYGPQMGMGQPPMWGQPAMNQYPMF